MTLKDNEPEVEDESDADWDKYSGDLHELLFAEGSESARQHVPLDEDGNVDVPKMAVMLTVAMRALHIIAKAPHFEGAAFLRRTLAAYTHVLLKNMAVDPDVLDNRN